MSRSGIASFLAMEDLTGDVVEVAEDALQLDGEAGKVLEENETELLVQETEIQETEDAIEEAFEGYEGLREIIHSMEAIAANGGLDRSGAVMLNHCRDHIYNRFGIKRVKYVAVENFGGRSDRITATRLAMEEDNAASESIFSRIIAAIKDMLKRVGEFITSWVTQTGRAIRRAEAVKAKASEAKFNYKLSDKEAEKYGPLFNIDGKQVSAMQAMDIVNQTIQAMKEESWADSNMKLIESLKSGIKEVAAEANPKSFMEKFLPKIVAVFDFFGGKTERDSFKKFLNSFDSKVTEDAELAKHWSGGGENGIFLRGEILPGNKALCYWAGQGPGPDGQEGAGLHEVRVDFAQVRPIAEGAKSGDELLPKNSADVVNVCDKVIEVCKSRERVGESIKKFISKATAAVESLEAQTKSVSGEVKEAVNKFVRFVNSIINVVSKPYTALAKYCVGISVRCLDVCMLSVKDGSSDGDAKAEDKEADKAE